jgi:low temperature requirement protein LtrA
VTLTVLPPHGPLVLVGAYLLVRCVHLILYAVAAAGDRELRHQLAITWGPLLASAALLVAGVLVGGWTQTLLFAAALLVDWVGVWLTSRQGNWRLPSAGHWTERHGLFIILAIGESVVAIGVGAAQPISTPLLVGAVLGVAVAVGLWWLYFDVAWLAAEHRLAEARGQARARLALEAYTFGHFPIVAGIVLAALGVSKACWPMPRRPSRWAPSTRFPCSVGWRCTWPGSCCSSSACTTC